jgi:hypothetical protein
MSVLIKGSYKEILESGDIIRRIFSQKKIRIDNRSYINKCLTSAHKLYDSWEKKDYGIIKNGTIFEILPHALECHRIGTALKWVEKKHGLEEKLKLILKGSIWPYDKFKKNKAKDTAFEVYTMARFEKVGLQPRFEEPDIVFKHGNMEFSIACKFIHSERKLATNIKKAVRQIQNSGKLGIIALCIDEISPHKVIHNSAVHFDIYLNGIFGRFIEKYDTLLNRIIRPKEVIGLIMSYSTSIVIKDIDLPTFVEEWGVNPRCGSTSSGFANLYQVVKKLKSLEENKNASYI